MSYDDVINVPITPEKQGTGNFLIIGLVVLCIICTISGSSFLSSIGGSFWALFKYGKVEQEGEQDESPDDDNVLDDDIDIDISDLEPPVDDTQEPPIDDTQEPPIDDTQEPPIDDTQEPPIDDTQEPPIDDTQEPPIDDTQEPPVDDTQEPPIDDTIDDIQDPPIKIPIRKPPPIRTPIKIPTPKKPPIRTPIKIPTPKKPPIRTPIKIPTPKKPPIRTPIKIPTPKKPPIRTPIKIPTPKKPPIRTPIKIPISKTGTTATASKDNYTYHNKKGFIGYNINGLPSKDSLNELINKCTKDDNCQAVATRGWFYYHVPQPAKWNKYPSGGFYVKKDVPNYTFFRNKDSHGNDISSKAPISLNEAKKTCNKNYKCKGFTYTPDKKAYYKNKINKVSDWNDKNWGTRYGFYMRQKYPDYTQYYNVDSKGSDIKKLTNISVSSSRIECNKDPKCKGFVYDEKNRQGWLKSSIKSSTRLDKNDSYGSYGSGYGGLYVKNIY